MTIEQNTNRYIEHLVSRNLFSWNMRHKNHCKKSAELVKVNLRKEEVGEISLFEE